ASGLETSVLRQNAALPSPSRLFGQFRPAPAKRRDGATLAERLLRQRERPARSGPAIVDGGTYVIAKVGAGFVRRVCNASRSVCIARRRDAHSERSSIWRRHSSGRKLVDLEQLELVVQLRHDEQRTRILERRLVQRRLRWRHSRRLRRYEHLGELR